MARNQPQIDLGQSGGAYLNDTGAYTPPTGKVIAYVKVMADNTTIALLTPANDTGTHHLGTTVVATALGNGLNAEALPNDANWSKGDEFYGRFSALTLTDGSVIMYFADA